MTRKSFATFVLLIAALFASGCSTDPFDEYLQATWDGLSESERRESCEIIDPANADDGVGRYRGTTFFNKILHDILDQAPALPDDADLSDERTLEFMEEECGL